MRIGFRYYVVIFCVVIGVAVTAKSADVDKNRLKISCDSINVEFQPLVNSSANVIQDQYKSLSPLVELLKESRSGSDRVVSIFHIGDSHIQAGFLSGHIRTYFQSNFGNAGRGLITPLKLVETNEPDDYQIYSKNKWTAIRCIDRGLTEKVGITGLYIYTQQKEIDFLITSKSEFCIVRAFHHPLAPMLSEPADLEVGSYCPDGNTSTSTDIFLNKSVNRVELTAIAGGEYSLGQYCGFSLENGNPGILYHSMGLNGASFEHYNKNTEVASQSRLLSADLIIISLGTNDAFGNTFDSHLAYLQVETLVQHLRQYNPQASILLTTPIQCFRKAYSKKGVTYVPNENVEKMAEVIIQVAQSNKVAYWDAYTACGGLNTCENWSKYGLFQKDMAHLSREGYDFKAKLFAEAFSCYYNSMI